MGCLIIWPSWLDMILKGQGNYDYDRRWLLKGKWWGQKMEMFPISGEHHFHFLFTAQLLSWCATKKLRNQWLESKGDSSDSTCTVDCYSWQWQGMVSWEEIETLAVEASSVSGQWPEFLTNILLGLNKSSQHCWKSRYGNVDMNRFSKDCQLVILVSADWETFDLSPMDRDIGQCKRNCWGVSQAVSAQGCSSFLACSSWTLSKSLSK